MEEEKQCILVIFGATDKGQRELISHRRRYRESASPGSKFCSISTGACLEMGPQLALDDGATRLLEGAPPSLPRRPRATLLGCKTGNVLNKLTQGSAKESQGAPCKTSGWPKPGRMPRAPSTSSWKPTGRSTTRPSACLAKDRDVLLTFYDFPAEHGVKHVARPNPIESTSPRFVCAPTGPRAACHARRRWPWSSNYARRSEKMEKTRWDHSPRSFAASNS